MKLNNILRLRIKSSLLITLCYTLWFIVVEVVLITINHNMGQNLTFIYGDTLYNLVFVALLGFFTINVNNKLCIQNGVSRTTSLVAMAIAGTVVSAIIATVQTLVEVIAVKSGNVLKFNYILTRVFGYDSLFSGDNLQAIIADSIFLFAILLGGYMLGIFLMVAITKVPKYAGICIIAAVPTTIFLIIPLLKQARPATEGAFSLFSIVANSLSGRTFYNASWFEAYKYTSTLPAYVAIFSILWITMAIAACTYRINRKLTYK